MNDDDRFLMAFVAIIYAIFFLGTCSVDGGEITTMQVRDTLWINEARKITSTNPFFTKGITITLDGKRIELGFRNDGVMVWREKKQ